MTSIVHAQERPAPARPLTAIVLFGWRALLKIKHVPEQLADVVGIPILFTLMFTYLFGGALAGSTHDYLQFLLPGTVVMAVVLVSIYTGTTLNADVAGGAFDRFRSLPVWRPAPIVGGLLGDLGRYLIAATLVVALGFAMGYDAHGGAFGVLAAVALVLVFSGSLSWMWTTVGLLVRTPQAVQSLGLLILFPLTFCSNIFVAPRTMPAWLRAVVDGNPISHLVTAARGLMSGHATAGQVGWVIVASVAVTAVFAPLTMRLYRRRG